MGGLGGFGWVTRIKEATNDDGIESGGFYQPFNSNLAGAGVSRLRGLPFDCNDIDICKFFTGLDIVDCLLVNKNGRFTGEAFVVFPTTMQAEFALHRNRQNMGRSQNTADPHHPKAEEASEDKGQMEYTEVLKLRGPSLLCHH
ncbi:hypothetical protein HU200_026348 [Digitaria exilis]|uniref:RRM domain-containing protein n=1 Tax=Digitaria exilis TaxID=1010633 RepID=A0A835C7E8_9POAL|nr:hypothetical protein HU200_026348 [Digitaria exilis]